MGNLPEITTLWMRNPPEEGDSIVKYQLVDEESTRRRGFHRELPAYLRGFRTVRSKFAENPLNSNKFQDQQLQILYTDNANFLKI
jgi:hypothetical protein